MSSRTIIMISLLIAVAMIVSVFAYLYRSQVDVLIDRYISKITVCGNILDEKSCFAKDFCEGIYGASCPECEDLEFKRCQRIPLKVSVQIEKEKQLCQDTGGEWYRNKLGNFCLCQQAGLDKTFNRTKGCIDK